MRYLVLVVLAPLLSLSLLLARPRTVRAATCTFDLGFATLHSLIPSVVGDCLRNAHFSPLTGDGFQETTGPTGDGGLLIWRAASNITSFTDGYHTWLLGPFGLQVRLNSERFDWERSLPTEAIPSCRSGEPLANVHDPGRLLVVQSCQVVVGTVRATRVEDDGDVFINLDLEPSERVLLSEANVTKQRGTMVLEIVPADQPGCLVGLPPLPPRGSANFGICTGANLPTPTVGSTIEAFGPYVLDTNHGWMEIHPVWTILPAS